MKMDIRPARTRKEIGDAAALMRGLVDANKTLDPAP